jgi:hypothetical protein
VPKLPAAAVGIPTRAPRGVRPLNWRFGPNRFAASTVAARPSMQIQKRKRVRSDSGDGEAIRQKRTHVPELSNYVARDRYSEHSGKSGGEFQKPVVTAAKLSSSCIKRGNRTSLP